MKKTINVKDLNNKTWKNIETLGDLKNMCNQLIKMGIPDKVSIYLSSDEEGNRISKILCFDYDEGLILVPWEVDFDDDFDDY